MMPSISFHRSLESLFGALLMALLLAHVGPLTANAQSNLVLSQDMVLDAGALLMPRGSTYGPAINGLAHQSEAMVTMGDYQYATWYHLGPDNEDVYLARRALSGTSWEVMDTGENLVHGDSPAWDNHNVAVLGVSGDGAIHLSWDHHGHTLRYMNTDAGAATGATWDASIMNGEQDSLNIGDPAINGVTYPRFIVDPNTGDMLMTYRTGGSGNGDIQFATFDATTGLWGTPHEIIDGQAGVYTDALGSSGNRNAYLNGMNVDASGRIHTTWTWRESAGGANHDIMYAYSDDGGDTWKNNGGVVVGSVGSPIHLDSPGITVVEMDRRNTLMNQQTQVVGPDGVAHAIMWHATDENADSVSGFDAEPSAYYHYYRNSADEWVRNDLPTEFAVGSRGDMGCDEDGNLYVAYVSGGSADGVTENYYASGQLVIATASKATQWRDWEVVYTDSVRDFVGEPRLDHARLQQHGVLSTFAQENGDNVGAATGSPLRVLEFDKLANNLVWAGDASNVWRGAGGDPNWDSQGDDVGDAIFTNAAAQRVTFDDGAGAYNVVVADSVTPSGTTFRNSASSYTLTGHGVAGHGDLRLMGGGMVTLNNAANTYAGDTNIESGKLVLAGAATISNSPNINVAEGATLDVAGLHATFTLASGQTLNNDSAQTVNGDVNAASGSVVTGSGGTYAGAVVMQSGSTLRVGGAELLVSTAGDVALIDDFTSGSLADYAATVILDADPGNGANAATWQTSGGMLEYETTSHLSIEQGAFIHDGTTLGVGEEIVVQLDHSGASQDIGLYVGGTTPVTGVREDYISVYARDNGQVLSRGFDGTEEFSLAGTRSADFDTLFVARIDANTYEAGYYSGDSRTVIVTRTPATPNDGSIVGFYTDVRGEGTLGAIDRFGKLLNDSGLVGETLTVAGDLMLQSGSSVQFNIGTAGICDLLSISGILDAGGGLDVKLDASLDSLVDLAYGDSWNLFNFAMSSGSFESFQLPALATGLFWDTSSLLFNGVLSITDVAPGLLGDYNDDGVVDAADYTVWRDNLGAPDTVLPPGSVGDGSGVVDAGDYQTWRDNFGATSAAVMLTDATVPEPASLVALLLAAGLHALAFNIRTHRRTRN